MPGTIVEYSLPEASVVIKVRDPTALEDGFGRKRTTVPVEATWTYPDAITLETHYVDLETRHVIRHDRQEENGSPVIQRYLQPYTDFLIRERFFGSQPYLLPFLLHDYISREFVIFETPIQARLEATPDGHTLTTQFRYRPVPEGPEETRSLEFRYGCGDWPTGFGELVGLGYGFASASLADVQIPDRPALDFGTQSVELGFFHVLAEPAKEPELSGGVSRGSLSQAVAAARMAPGYQTSYAPAHPEHFVAAAYHEREGPSTHWTIQFAQVNGEVSYETEVVRHDVRVEAAAAPVAMVATAEGALKKPFSASYPYQYWAMQGFASLDHAVEDATGRLGAHDVGLVALMDPEWFSGAEELVFLAVADDGRSLSFSAINGQLLEEVLP